MSLSARRRLAPACLLLVLSAVFPARTIAQAPDTERRSLIGIEGLSVLIESPGEDAEKDGLSEDDLRTDVELRLRQSGIRVLTVDEGVQTPGAPYMYVNVNAMKVEKIDHYVYNITVEVNQNVNLARRPTWQAYAATWDMSVIGIISEDDLEDEVRDTVKDLVDRMLNDLLAMNEAPPTSYGAPTPLGAIQLFLNAVQASDYQAMSRLFGTADGPADRVWGTEETVAQMRVIATLITHSDSSIKYQDISETGSLSFSVCFRETTLGDVAYPFLVTRANKGGRYFVENIRLDERGECEP